MLNPQNDNLGSSWTKSRPEPKKPEKDEPVEHYREKDDHLWDLEALWGPQEPRQRWRNGRPVKEEE